MFFQKMYKPIPLAYNLVLAMLWRHPENVELEKVKVVHYCAAVSTLLPSNYKILFKEPSYFRLLSSFDFLFCKLNRVQSPGGILVRKLIWTERTSRCQWKNGGIFIMMSLLISRKKILLRKKRHIQGHPSSLLCRNLPFLTFRLPPPLEKSFDLKRVFKLLVYYQQIYYILFLGYLAFLCCESS